MPSLMPLFRTLAVPVLALSLIGVALPPSPLSALEVATLVTANGEFDANAVRGRDNGVPDCLDVVNGGTDPVALDQARFGRPSALTSPDCGSLNQRSGFGFTGVSLLPVTSIDRFEIGRFTHYNQPIDQDDSNVGSATLNVTMDFANLGTITPDYVVTLDETDNSPVGGVCAYTDTPNIGGCDDLLSILAPSVPPLITYENTQFAINLGFAPLTGNSCGDETPLESVYTAEGQNTTFCLIGTPIPATIQLIKHAPQDRPETFFFTLQEHSQVPGSEGEPIGSPLHFEVQTSNGIGLHSLNELEPGLYSLVETDLPGWDEGDPSCTASGGDNSPIALLDGTTYLDLDSSEVLICQVHNTLSDDIDLELVKADGGVEAQAGGAPFDYTLTIRNVSFVEPDPNQPITLTDRLPEHLVYESVPPFCSTAGPVMTCQIDTTTLSPGNETTITVGVRALSTAPSGHVVNMAWIDHADDPLCETAGCVPLCSDFDNNNVHCETTPILRTGDIDIVKVDHLADDAAVQPDESFSYTLEVTNTGITTLADGIEVVDELPAELDLVSVGGTNWTCADGASVRCDYGPALEPGEKAAAITVSVRVRTDIDASVEQIENTASVRAAVDRSCLVGGGDAAFEPACNEVSDSDDETTPVVQIADPAISKRSDVGQITVGDEFDWILDVDNLGPATAVNVVVSDALPAEVDGVSASSNEFDCALADDVVTCTKPSLAVGETATITVRVKVVDVGETAQIVNLATIDSDTKDANRDNNVDDDVVTGVANQPPTTIAPPPVTLPATGSDPATLAGAAAALLILGGFTLLVSRRTRHT